jgi:glycerophosphoryl diester phosphodiesterase
MDYGDKFKVPFAHRGLHNAAEGRIENTVPAFVAAMLKGYGIECDLRPAAGGLPVVFHDEEIDRLMEGKGLLANLVPAEVRWLKYRGQNSHMITFADLLKLVEGRVPLLVEIKSEWAPPDRSFLSQIADLANNYMGPIALMSFDPDVMAVMKEKTPDIPRGIISGSYQGEGWWNDKLTPYRQRQLANLEFSGPAEPDFYAYHVKDLAAPAVQHWRKYSGKPLFTWTVRSAEDRGMAAKYADVPIFEGFEP